MSPVGANIRGSRSSLGTTWVGVLGGELSSLGFQIEFNLVSWCVDISESAFLTTLAKIKRQVSKSFGAKPPCQDTLFLLTLNRIHGLVEDLEVADRVGGGTASSKRSGCQQDDT